MLAAIEKNRRGLTLVEMLITTLIFAAILGVMFSLQITVTDLFHTSKDRVDIQAQARIALDFMTAELKNATRTSAQNPSPNLTIPSTPNNNSIQFYLPEDKDGDGLITDANGEIEWATNQKIHYTYVPGQKKLMRLEPGNNKDKNLVHDVTSVQFIDADIDPALNINELKIILMLDKQTSQNRNVTLTLTSIVRLRN